VAAIALVGSYELLMTVIRSSQTAPGRRPGVQAFRTRFRKRRSRYSPVIWQRIAFPRSARSALNSTASEYQTSTLFMAISRLPCHCVEHERVHVGTEHDLGPPDHRRSPACRG
jgi:hypothetical protein